MQGNERSLWSSHRATLALLGLALAIGGCSSTGGKPQAPIEARDASGFSITETTRASNRAREDFTQANEAMASGELNRAITLLAEIVRTAPELTAAQINLGIAYQRKGDLVPAEKALLAAVERSPRHPVAQNELGIVYRQMGRFADARTRFESALSDHPEFHPAHKNLAILCDLYLADPACALEHYESYRKAVPEDAKVEIWIADLRNRIGR